MSIISYIMSYILYSNPGAGVPGVAPAGRTESHTFFLKTDYRFVWQHRNFPQPAGRAPCTGVWQTAVVNTVD
jgi:hypothetical protein